MNKLPPTPRNARVDQWRRTSGLSISLGIVLYIAYDFAAYAFAGADGTISAVVEDRFQQNPYLIAAVGAVCGIALIHFTGWYARPKSKG